MAFFFSFSECYKIVLKRFSEVDVFCHSNCAILVSHQNCLLVVSYSNLVWSFLIDLTLVYIASTCISICRGQLSGISSVSGIQFIFDNLILRWFLFVICWRKKNLSYFIYIRTYPIAETLAESF